MALASARGLRESSVKSQLGGIVRGGLLARANLLFFCASRATVARGLLWRSKAEKWLSKAKLGVGLG
jgi:hypothetical protein